MALYFISVSMSDNMTSEHKDELQWLKEHQHYMYPKPVVEYLYTNKALSMEQRELVKSKATKTGQNMALLSILEKQKDWTYYCLLHGLEKNEQSHVVDILSGGTYVNQSYNITCVFIWI